MIQYYGHTNGVQVYDADGYKPALWWAWDTEKKQAMWVDECGRFVERSAFVLGNSALYDLVPCILPLADPDLVVDEGL